MPVDICIEVEIPSYQPGEGDELAREIGLGEPTESNQQRLELITSAFTALEPKQSNAIRWYYSSSTKQDDWTTLHAPEAIVKLLSNLKARKLFDEYEFRHTMVAGAKSWVLIGTHKSDRGDVYFVLARWGECMPDIETIERGHRYYVERHADSDRLNKRLDTLLTVVVIVIFMSLILGLAAEFLVIGLLGIGLACLLLATMVILTSKANRIRRTADPQARRSCEPERILG